MPRWCYVAQVVLLDAQVVLLESCGDQVVLLDAQVVLRGYYGTQVMLLESRGAP